MFLSSKRGTASRVSGMFVLKGQLHLQVTAVWGAVLTGCEFPHIAANMFNNAGPGASQAGSPGSGPSGRRSDRPSTPVPGTLAAQTRGCLGGLVDAPFREPLRGCKRSSPRGLPNLPPEPNFRKDGGRFSVLTLPWGEGESPVGVFVRNLLNQVHCGPL